MILRKMFFKLVDNSAFRKQYQDNGDIKLTRTEQGGNYLVLEVYYHITKRLIRNLLVIEMRK